MKDNTLFPTFKYKVLITQHAVE